MFIRRQLRQLGAIMMGIVWQALLLLLVIEGYAFQPHRLMLTCVWVVMLVVVATAAGLLIETNRDPVLSRIAGTTPGKFEPNWELFSHASRWVVLPLIAMAAAQYPRATGSLASLLEPLLRALK